MSVHSMPAPRFRWLVQLVAVLLLLGIAVVAQAASYDLTAAPANDAAYRVSVELEFGGELLAPATVAVGAAAAEDAKPDAEPKRAPLKVDATLAYDERRVSDERSARFYRTAEATIQSGAATRLPRLAPDRRLILVDHRAAGESAGRATLASPAGPLSRETLDLVDIVGDASVLDQLLPGETIEEGGEWRVDKQVMATLLGLDSVAVCEIRCVLDDGNRKYARFQMAGAVHGEVDAAATEFEVRAIGLFSRTKQAVTQLNLAVTEKRAVGPARPGVEGTAKLKIKREAIRPPAELKDAALAKLKPAEATQELELQAGRQGFTVAHDRNWYVAAHGRESITLRRVEPTGMVAQTTLRHLPAKSAGRESTLASFEKEIRFSLGEAFVQLVSSEKWTNAAGCHCLGLVVDGNADGVPLQWRYYMVMPGDDAPADAQHRVSLATTVEAALADRVGDADRDLANRLQLTPPEKNAAGLASITPEDADASKKRSQRRRKTARIATRPTRRAGGIRQR